MAFTTPRTWTAGELVTAAMMNTDVKDNMTDVDARLKADLFVRKAVTETRVSSPTLTNDAALTRSVVANTTYRVEIVINYDSSVAADFRIQVVAPGSATFVGLVSGLHANAAGTNDDSIAKLRTGDASLPFGGLGVGVLTGLQIVGNLVVAATAGTFAFQWCQDTTSTAETRVFFGSHMHLQKVG